MGARASTQQLVVTGALVLALCLLVLPGAASHAQTPPSGANFVPGQIIVKVASGTKIGEIAGTTGTRVAETFPDVFEGGDVYLLKITDGLSTKEKIDEILSTSLSGLIYVEPNFLADAPEATARHRAFPDDETKPTPNRYSSEQYSATALNLSSSHRVSEGGGTTVAVLDTGAQLGHPALKANFKGVARRDFVDDDRDPSEPPFARNKVRRNAEVVGHGTHVAGIVDLVAPKAKIMPLRVLNRKGRGNVFDISKAVFFAERNGADVINLSLGTPGPTPAGLVPPELLRETVDEAIRRGVVAAAAAGNSGKPYPNYPAARGQTADDHDGLLAVTSVSCREQKSEWANYGLWVDIASPGEGILSAFPVRRYANWSGTSMATPFVSGQAALIRADDNTLDPAGVEVQIRDSARPLVGRDIVFGTFLGAGQTDIGASLGQPDPVPEPALCPAS